jgi:hypothetical protein
VTITEFLTARLDEDEAVARAALHVPGSDEFNWSDVDYNSVVADAHGLRWKPERVLADVAAKRAIVEEHTCQCPDPGCGDCGACSGDHHADPTPAPCTTVRLLAQPYADHPDFDPAWRVS